MKAYQRLFRALFRTRRDRARELDEEIASHIDMRVAELVDRGVSEPEARRIAQARFGDMDRARREIAAASARRDLRLGLGERVGGVRRDLVLALRRMRAAPGHAGTSVAIFALGIGLTTVMFTVVDHVLLRPLPFPEPERLVALWSVPEEGDAFAQVSMGNWYDWREGSRSIESTALFRARPMTVTTDRDVFTARGQEVAGAFFEALRPAMTVGRPFTESDGQEGSAVVVVSEGFWRRVLGAPSSLEGRALTVDGVSVEVVGVVRAGSEFPAGTEVWRPFRYRPFAGGARNNINWEAVARLGAGVSGEQATAELSGIADGIRTSDPAGIYSWGVGVKPLQEVVVGEAGAQLLMLMGAVLFVLLIACANLMALGFARGADRTGEVALRLSLGAGRGRLVQQLLTEQVVLAAVGGALGLWIAAQGTRALMAGLGNVVPRAHEIGFDVRVAAFGAGLSLLAGALAGLAPAWRVAGGAPARALAGVRQVRGGRGLPGAFLVAAEVALTVLLLTGGALLLRSYGAIVSRDLGFVPERVVTADVVLASLEYRDAPDRVSSYWTALLDDLRGMPSLEWVAAGNWIPTTSGGKGFIELEGNPDPDAGAGYRVVSDHYFAALGIPLLAGRSFGPDDVMGSPRVVLVNETMARIFWPDRDPLGQLVKATSMEAYFHGGEAPWLTVVGVVGDVRHYGFEEDVEAEMYVLYRQAPYMATQMTVVARAGAGSLGTVMSEMRERVRAVDRSLAVNVSTLEGRVSNLLARRRLVTSILSGFGAVALLLAALGVYGVISYAVATRTREMAVRAALGARRASLVRLVLGGALWVVMVGGAAGVALSIGLRGTLASLLVEVSSTDPVSYLAAGLMLVGVAVAAALVPAVRAARLDPLEALRE